MLVCLHSYLSRGDTAGVGTCPTNMSARDIAAGHDWELGVAVIGAGEWSDPGAKMHANTHARPFTFIVARESLGGLELPGPRIVF